MNLRKKTLLIIASGYSLIIILFIIYATISVESQYRSLEQEYVTQESLDLSKHIGEQLQNMDRILRGYSGWNDTYRYVQDQNSKFIDTNYKPDYLPANGISGVLIYNRQGDLLFQMIEDPQSGKIIPISPASLQNISIISEEYDLLSKTSGVHGIISFDNNDALIASEPVLTDSYEGPAQGTIHYILWLNSEFLNQTSESIDHQVRYEKNSVSPISSQMTHPDIFNRYPKITVIPHNATTIDGSFLIPGLSKQEEYQFIVSLDRSIYQSGMKNIVVIILFLIFSGLFIGVIVLTFIDKFLLTRIDVISRKIMDTRSSSSEDWGSPKTFYPDGQDELDILYDAIEPVFAHIAKAQDELKQSEIFFRQVADTIRDGLLIFETTGENQEVVYCNPRSLEILGGSCNNINIADLLSLAVPEEQTRVMAEWNGILNYSHPNSLIGFWIHNFSGEKKYLLARFSFIPSDIGIIRILLVISDITERKTTEELLRESEAKYRFMIENISDVHWQITPDLTFTYISPSDEILRGYHSNEVIGRKVWDFIPPFAREKFKRKVSERYIAHKSGKKLDTEAFEVEWKCKDGSVLWIEIISNPIYDYDENLIGFHGIYHNITERKIAEEAIRQANKKLNLLASITRHDVLNQMTVIISTLELMKEEDLSPFIQSLIKTEDDAADKIIRLIQFARDYQDIGLTVPQWFKVRDLVDHAVSALIISDIVINFRIDSLSIFADALLEKVFFNLIDNSMRHGGSVTAITIDGYSGDDGYHLIFSDNGAGIAPCEHEKIFARGYGKNTGMGLFLIREILSITGISIDENGTFGEGARFEMIIPEGRYRIVPGDK